MNKPFSWVSNQEKFERAKAVAGPDATEEQIQEKYEAFGGLVLPSYEIPEVSAEAPKKSKKK